MIEYSSFKLKEGWPKRLSSLGFPPNTFIDTVINTNRGQTYAIFNGNDLAQIDECSMTVRSFQPLQAVLPGIPPAPTLVFRYINGNLYFAKQQQFYTFNEFTKIVTEVGKFNINVLNVECLRNGLLQQMQDILDRLFQSSNTYWQNIHREIRRRRRRKRKGWKDTYNIYYNNFKRSVRKERSFRQHRSYALSKLFFPDRENVQQRGYYKLSYGTGRSRWTKHEEEKNSRRDNWCESR